MSFDTSGNCGRNSVAEPQPGRSADILSDILSAARWSGKSVGEISRAWSIRALLRTGMSRAPVPSEKFLQLSNILARGVWLIACQQSSLASLRSMIGESF
jgi:hypothetical protein